MPLYTKTEITIPGGSPANNPQYTIAPITAPRALDTGRANNIPDNYPNTATTSGGWVWINPDYEFATELLAAYKDGTFTGGPEEVAGRGVQLRMFSDLVNVNTSTVSSTQTGQGLTGNSGGSTAPHTPGGSSTTSNSNTSGGSTLVDNPNSADSPRLANYIETELRVETKKQYPELNSMEETPEMVKSLKVLSTAMARAIKKYLNQDVKTVQLGLQVDPTGLNIGGITNADGVLTGIDVDPNPHSHSINPHRHDIVAP